MTTETEALMRDLEIEELISVILAITEALKYIRTTPVESGLEARVAKIESDLIYSLTVISSTLADMKI
jgi:hypothetical protein